jgi:hypothetical protein
MQSDSEGEIGKSVDSSMSELTDDTEEGKTLILTRVADDVVAEPKVVTKKERKVIN